MNRTLIRILIILMSASLIGLIGIQFYWINIAIKVKGQSFDKSVIESLNNVADIIEKKEVTKQLKKIITKNALQNKLLDSDSLNNTLVNEAETLFYQAGNPQRFSFNTTRKIEFSDSTIHKLTDKERIIKVNQKAPVQKMSDEKNEMNKLIKRRTKFLNSVIRDLMVDNIFKKVEAVISRELVDSVIRTELQKKGIEANFEFGVQNIKNDSEFTIQKTARYKNELLQSNYKVKLYPKDIFSNQEFLMVYFPSQTQYILKTMWIVLLTSGLFVSIIVLGFLFTILFIIRQRKITEIKNDFINNITHELKTPISTISLACEALSDTDFEKSTSNTQKFLRLIEEENKRLGVLTENIMQTSLLEKGNLKFDFQNIDVHKIINEVIRNISIQIEKKQGRVITNLEAKRNIIFADKIHMTNMVYNLLDNANKYSLEKPLIFITTKDIENGIEITFEDNGIGIGKSSQRKIFDKLYRVSTGNIHDVKGYGLGLNYVKAIVEKHNGKIEVESELNKGSKFIITINDNKNNTNERK
ncbi:MAG: HAMP domain-containing sensor histidine kinase [Bacteroidales bacterium]|nr:HAMP domain-containing sensor histidine kinase [Bacteroidales bacterium]